MGKLSKLGPVVLGAVLALGLSSTAAAVSLPFTGSLSIQIASFAAFGAIAGSGTAQINGSGAGGHLTSLAFDAGVFQASHLEIPIDDLSFFPIVGMQLTAANQAGSFAGSGGAGFGGVMPVPSVLKLCTYPSPCSAAVTNLSVPLPIGQLSATQFVTGGALNLTVVGAPWTTGTAVVGTATLMGGVAPLSNTGAASGSVTLVTPIFISSTFPAAVLPSFGVLTLHFVPEPATLALLGIAIAGLAAFGRGRAAPR